MDPAKYFTDPEATNQALNFTLLGEHEGFVYFVSRNGLNSSIYKVKEP